MTNVFVFLSYAIIIFGIGSSIYQLVTNKVKVPKYEIYRKLAIFTACSLPWIFLFFPFTTDWSTYWTLVIIRVPITIIWFILTLIALHFDVKRQNKSSKK